MGAHKRRCANAVVVRGASLHGDCTAFLEMSLRLQHGVSAGVSLITAGYHRIPQDTAGSLDMGVFNEIYHIITWNRHFIINNSKYLHLFFFVGKKAMQYTN